MHYQFNRYLFNSLTGISLTKIAFVTKQKLHFSLICRFHCCLVKEERGEPWKLLSNLPLESYSDCNSRISVFRITTTQLHSTNPELKFCASSIPIHGMLDICDSKSLYEWSRLEKRLDAFSSSTFPFDKNNSSSSSSSWML